MTKLAYQCYIAAWSKTNLRNNDNQQGNLMLFSPSSHLGESLFTSTRIKDSKILFDEEHLERLVAGIEDYYLGEKLSSSQISELQEAIDKQVSKLDDKEAKLRITVHASDRQEITPSSFDFKSLNVSVESGPLTKSKDEVRCKSFQSPFAPSYPNIKMGSYMPLLRLRLKAQRAGLEDAALLDEQGNLMELTTSNLFFYKGKRVFTPSKTLLDGVIKKTICEMFSVEKLDITPGSCAEFDGCFCTNSVWIARPVQSIDQTKFKNSDQLFVEDMIKKILERGYQ